MTDQSSAAMAVDPDRLILEQFENGNGEPATAARKIERVPINEEDQVGCATFAIRNEDHTVGNLLRHVLMLDPDVEFCGYSQPHPSEAKIHLRIQTRSSSIPAVDVLTRALERTIRLAQATMEKYQNALEHQSYRSEKDDQLAQQQ